LKELQLQRPPQMVECVLSIVNYNTCALLDRCLGHIVELGLPSDWRIVVVDNASADGSADMVSRKYPGVQLLAQSTNTGFGGGHNLAFAATRSRYFVVLNPDVIVLPGSIERLLEVLRHRDRAAIVGPCLLNPDKSSQRSARRFYTWRTVLARRLPLPGRNKVIKEHLMQDVQFTEVTVVDWLLGAALAIRRSAFKDERLFDPRYRLYFEDVDLCYFAHQAGWDVLYCPDSMMIHDHWRASARRFINRAKFDHFCSWVKFYLKSKTSRHASVARRSQQLTTSLLRERDNAGP